MSYVFKLASIAYHIVKTKDEAAQKKAVGGRRTPRMNSEPERPYSGIPTQELIVATAQDFYLSEESTGVTEMTPFFPQKRSREFTFASTGETDNMDSGYRTSSN